MSSALRRVALVTGANKGIGYHIVQQFATAEPASTVLLGARDSNKGKEALATLKLKNIEPLQLDIDEPSSIERAVREVKQKYGGLDLLVNNAGRPGMAFKGDAFDENVVNRTFQTNYYGTLNTINSFLPLMNPKGRIINVSSGTSVTALGKMSSQNRERFLNEELTIEGLTALMNEFKDAVVAKDWKEKGWPSTAYGMSKVGVSIMTRILAKQMKNGVTINSGCPGWCRTDMAGPRAPRTAEEGASTFVHIMLLPDEGISNGEYWEDKKVSSLTRGGPAVTRGARTSK